VDSLPGFTDETEINGLFVSGGIEFYPGENTMLGLAGYFSSLEADVPLDQTADSDTYAVSLYLRHKFDGGPVIDGQFAMANMGFDLTHTYGLTEVYGPASVATRRPAWAAESRSEQTRLNGRQGVRYALQDGMTVMDPETMAEVPADGTTLGEIMFRGNITMKGYLKNPSATDKAFEGGWFHTGDLAVLEPDRYVKIKDRSKDIIISGCENISSIEVEDALYRHPAVMACAVVARPDAKWGETPLAYVEAKPGSSVTAEELVAHCKQLLAGYKVPREIRFEPIPKTSTGKIQKFELRQRAQRPPGPAEG
jgi:fatty-acyl-CoA synthase